MIMSDPIIAVENLSKHYVIEHIPDAQGYKRYTALRDVVGDAARNLARKALAAAHGRQIFSTDRIEEFWALKGVSFEVQRGEVVGIIGRNGAGKSTLLKVLSRITEPTGGRVILRGRVASLLEVGTGFHPELTGRENIYLNGAILGMSRAEIQRKFDEIVAFAEVERFVDTPVKRYSSGMYVRLAFAVAAHLEPEILVVDEVLAVGDAQFQKKCLGKIGEVSRAGRTVLLVSHNMRAIQQLCSRAILIQNGKLRIDGTTNQCITVYLSNDSVGDLNINSVDLQHSVVARKGSGDCQFTSFALTDFEGNPAATFLFGQPFRVEIGVRARRNVGEALLGFSFVTRMGAEIMGTTLADSGIQGYLEEGVTFYRCDVDPMILTPGQYTIRAAIFQPEGIRFDHIDAVMSFEVLDAPFDLARLPKSHYVGDVFLKYNWQIMNGARRSSDEFAQSGSRLIPSAARE
jgi:lipopolysaccharide transport system ATP-binding protein